MAKRFFISILSVFLLTLLLIFFVDFIEVLRSGSRADVGAGTVALITLLRIPIFAELALPFAILIGTITAFLSFSRTSELTIIRAAGLSVWQFVQPAIVVAFVMGIFAVTVYNPLAAALKAKSESIQAELFNTQKNFAAVRGTGAWLRQESVDGATILHAKASANRGLTLGGVTMLQFDLNKRFYEQIQASKAELKQGYWQLENVVVQGIGQPPQTYATYQVSTYLSPAQVMDSVGSIESLSFWQLPGFISFAEKAGLPIDRYRLQYDLFLVRPLLLAAMVLIAATCSLKSFRFGKIQTMVLTGLAGGFGFFILSEISRKLGASGVVPVTVAAWAPAVMASLLSVTVLLHQEDG
jgi:lipopolysaccharide export system permease protein